MTELKENVYKKANSKDEVDAIFENNFIKKIFYFPNAFTSHKFNFNSSRIWNIAQNVVTFLKFEFLSSFEF